MKITPDELEKIKELFRRMNQTPVIKVGEIDLSYEAKKDVAIYMDVLAEKYKVNFKDRKHGIDFNTGEIKLTGI